MIEKNLECKFNNVDDKMHLKTLGTIDLVQTNETELIEGIEYYVTIIDACIILDQIKVLFEFKDTTNGKCYNFLEVLTLGTKEYNLFLDAMYFHEYSNVIALNFDDFYHFSACCKGDCIKDGHIDWHQIEPHELPITSTSLRYDEKKPTKSSLCTIRLDLNLI